MTKRKKPLTCPVCKRRFTHTGKSHPMKRMSRHLWKEHKPYMLKKQKSGKKKKRPKESQLDTELQLADDLLLTLLVEVDKRLQQLEGQPIIHRDAMGMLIEYMAGSAKHLIKGEKPKKPLQRALLGALYQGGYEKK